MPTSTSPSASARRTIPFSKMLEKKPGKMVTISNRILVDDIGRFLPADIGRFLPDSAPGCALLVADPYG
jgi:hypothetical protein